MSQCNFNLINYTGMIKKVISMFIIYTLVLISV